MEHLKASALPRLERLARDKHSSLLQKSVNYCRKKFYSTRPWSNTNFHEVNVKITAVIRFMEQAGGQPESIGVCGDLLDVVAWE